MRSTTMLLMVTPVSKKTQFIGGQLSDTIIGRFHAYLKIAGDQGSRPLAGG